MNKPPACIGCPFYQDGKGFVPDRIVPGSKVFVYAQNPGKDEVLGEKYDGVGYVPHCVEPMIGKTGFALDNSYLPAAGLSRDEVSIGNAIRCRVGGKDELPPIDEVKTRQAMLHCHLNHFELPPSTKLIIAQGNYSLNALTQRGGKGDGIDYWRGFVLPLNTIGTPQRSMTDIWIPSPNDSVPVLATYHIAYTFREPIASLITRLDFSKVQKILTAKWPEKLPPIIQGGPDVWPLESAFDTEFDPYTGYFICYSLYDGKTLRVSSALDSGVINGSPHVVMHNAAADLTYLEMMFAGVPFAYDDTMHGHAVLWSDFPHDLGFLGSLYGRINAWKHLMHTNPRVYSAADAHVTWDVWQKIKQEYSRDAQSWKVYTEKQLPLVPIIRDAIAPGIRVNTKRCNEHYVERRTEIDSLNALAQAMVGWPINLRGAAQTGHQLFKVEKLAELLK